MFHRRRFNFYFAVTLATVALTGLAQAASPRVVLNPYADVDWQQDQRHRANFHTHTTQSDGAEKPADVIDHYKSIGYDVLALTDHNRNTWPWSKFGRDGVKLGMIAVSGNELSRHHHTLSLFSTLEAKTRDHETALQQTQEEGGIAVLAHPGRYWRPKDEEVPDAVRDRYVRLYKTYPNVVAMEVVNQTDRYPRDRALWDAVLTELMPQRPVWGMANDDSHRRSHVGLNASVLLLPELTSEQVRDALENGRYYFVTLTSHPAGQRNLSRVPVVRKIEYDQDANTLAIEADDGGKSLVDDQYRWITANGKLAHTGRILDLGKADGIKEYVRAEIRGSGGTAYTQPFGIGN